MTKARDALPERLFPVVDFLRAETAEIAALVVQVIELVPSAVNGTVFDGDMGLKMLMPLLDAQRRNGNIVIVLTLLRESGLEVAQREVERVEAVRKAQAKAAKK